MTVAKVWDGTAWVAIVGSTGPVGPAGAVAVYEQAAEPGSPVSGAMWIDTDDIPIQYGTYRPTLPVVTNLPSSPEDGQECYFQSASMLTKGEVWHLRYRATSTSPYKWEVVGGPSLTADGGSATTGLALVSWTWTDWANQPTIVTPLAGDWLVSGGVTAVMTAGTVPGEIESSVLGVRMANMGCGALNLPMNLAGTQRRLVNQAVGSTLKLMVASGGGTWTLRYSYLNAIPVRVG